MRRLFIVFSILCIGVLVQAAIINVSTTQDSIPGSLRAAITTANINNEDDTIYLPTGIYILTGAAKEDGNVWGDLDIKTSHEITIMGDGAKITIIDANQVDRIFHILNGTVYISNVTIQNGKTIDGVPNGTGLEIYAESGGGIYNSDTLTLTNCIIQENVTGNGGWRENFGSGAAGGGGGGIYNRGTLTLKNCTINNNTTGNGGKNSEPFSGGYGGYGGGVYNDTYAEDLTIINCTISSNVTGDGDIVRSLGGLGGGIFNVSNNEVNITNCTISHNTTGKGASMGGLGGGISNLTTCNIKNTIIANNKVASGGKGLDCYRKLNSQGYNLIENINDCNITGDYTGNIFGVDPMLGPLADNGGNTLTHALLPGSPAIDAGNSFGTSEDQRGYTRPMDIPNITNKSDGADIGAFEFEILCTISGTVTYVGTGFASVTLTFSNNGGTTTTNEEGYYSYKVIYDWTGTVTPSKPGYNFIPSNRSYNNVTTDHTNQDYTASPTISSQISLSRTQLNFGVDVTGSQTNPQTFLITNSGGGILYWTLSDDASWLNCSPTSRTNSGEVTVSVDASGLAPGTYYGTITVSAPNASNSPQHVNVTLFVYQANTTGVPFGYFETPRDGAYVYSSIPVTGWALDDIEVENVKIYRKEGKNLVYIGDAVFVEGARPDVELAYPNYPKSYRAGWGYMMLTNFLPDGGNGTFILYAIAMDKEGNQVTLGTKTILCDNAHAVKPFGAIDTPSQGGTAIGTNYRNQGWVLTPLPNKIPEDGHTIIVWIDGIVVGKCKYNIYRKDIAALFPGYANSNGAMAYFDFDTTAYENGVHIIQWTAVDNAGNVDGIGSRYFTSQNTGGSAESIAQSAERTAAAFNFDSSEVHPDYSSPIRIKKGYNQHIIPHKRFPDKNGNFFIEIKELERIEIHLFEGTRGLAPLPDFPGPPSNNRMGFQLVGNQLQTLPIGSTFNPQKGIFFWQPGPGFVGTYRFIFLEEKQNSELSKTFITVNILPKFTGKAD